MLTGHEKITSGDAYIVGKSVKKDVRATQKFIGYCPQFDAIISELTGRELIRLFARLRGIPEKEINDVIDLLATELLLTEHLDKPCGTYR